MPGFELNASTKVDSYLWRTIGRKIEGWRWRYNGERPHSALGNLAPVTFCLVATAGLQ